MNLQVELLALETCEDESKSRECSFNKLINVHNIDYIRI